MSKNILDNLFGSRSRVKVLKYIFRNYPSNFSISEVTRRVREPKSKIKNEVTALMKLGLIKKK